jgi:type II secretory pathway pseudopilin PulG
MKNHRPLNQPSKESAWQSPRSRRGSWLAQAVITMGIMSILMTIASTSLFQMFRQESRMVERAFQTSTWLQLSRDFREDGHAALTVKQSEDGSRLELVTPDGPVTWVADGEKIRRISQSLPSEDAADSPAIQSLPGEQYVFIDNVARFSLTVGTSGTATVASIEVAPLRTLNGGVAPSNVTVATVGLDHRFQATVAAAEAQP